mmetsp:Transcript_32702/g.54802  ORF Transcript_32702/g.54802 Transcript_32702/m.54802 type:complete len:152 (+) Transcript_32702:23-478(+)
MASILALLNKLELTDDTTDGRLVAALKGKLTSFWTALFQKLCVGVAEEVSIIYGLERAAATTTCRKLQSGMTFRFVLQTLHDEEVLSEEAILKWAEERKQENDDSPDDGDSSWSRVKLFHSQPVQDFLEWLEEESEEEEDESEDEEEGDSD